MSESSSAPFPPRSANRTSRGPCATARCGRRLRDRPCRDRSNAGRRHAAGGGARIVRREQRGCRQQRRIRAGAGLAGTARPAADVVAQRCRRTPGRQCLCAGPGRTGPRSRPAHPRAHARRGGAAACRDRCAALRSAGRGGDRMPRQDAHARSHREPPAGAGGTGERGDRAIAAQRCGTGAERGRNALVDICRRIGGAGSAGARCAALRCGIASPPVRAGRNAVVHGVGS